MRETTRRDWLRGLTVGGTVGVAGCVGDGPIPPGGSGTDATTPSATGTSTEGDAGTTDSTARGTATASATEIHASYETTEVTVRTPDGQRLGSVTAAIADTPELRYLGLSDTASMPEDRGMLFVYDQVDDHTFVMRRMSFGLDIVYADGEGVITTIHHAEKPGPNENGNEQEYPGRGQYVLEVNIGWTTERGVETGDVLEFSL